MIKNEMRYNEKTADEKYYQTMAERRRDIDEDPIHYFPTLEDDDDEDYSDEIYED